MIYVVHNTTPCISRRAVATYLTPNTWVYVEEEERKKKYRVAALPALAPEGVLLDAGRQETQD
jgi:hypothetical protein